MIDIETNMTKKSQQCNRGFTLIEILVALGMLGLIMAALYGSYQAVTRSIDMSSFTDDEQQAVLALAILDRQLRCCYAAEPKQILPEKTGSSKQMTSSLAQDNDTEQSYFMGECNGHEVTLQFVTSHKSLHATGFREELRQMTYIWSQSDGELLSSQQEYGMGLSLDHKEQAQRCVLDSVREMEMSFFDGQQWQSQWSQAEGGDLPKAVRIRLLVDGEDNRTKEYDNTVIIMCQGEGAFQNSETPRRLPEKLAL